MGNAIGTKIMAHIVEKHGDIFQFFIKTVLKWTQSYFHSCLSNPTRLVFLCRTRYLVRCGICIGDARRLVGGNGE